MKFVFFTYICWILTLFQKTFFLSNKYRECYTLLHSILPFMNFDDIDSIFISFFFTLQRVQMGITISWIRTNRLMNFFINTQKNVHIPTDITNWVHIKRLRIVLFLTTEDNSLLCMIFRSGWLVNIIRFTTTFQSELLYIL